MKPRHLPNSFSLRGNRLFFQPLLRTALLAFALFAASLAPLPAHAITYLSDSDASIYRNAFAELKSGNGQQALSIANGASNKLLYEIIAGLSLAAPDATADLAVYNSYLDGRIAWPKPERKAISKKAESRLAGQPPAVVIAFFANNEVQTVDGLLAYANALVATNEGAKAKGIIRNFWLEYGRDRDSQDQMLRDFSQALTQADIEARLDNLLWERRDPLAEQLMQHVGADWRKLATARMALAKMDDKAPRLLNAVPAHLQNQPGLLYERMRWRRKKDDAEGALAMMQRANHDLGRAKHWWDERNALARGLIDNGEYARAYRLVAAHGLKPDQGNAYAEAEFLSGWLAFRFLNNPKAAHAHFTRLYSSAETPITLARGAYWLARVSEATNRIDEANTWYKNAAIYGTTFYGQIAAARLYKVSQISAVAPEIGEPFRSTFENSPQATLIAQLAQAQGKEVAEDFALAWAYAMNEEYQFRLLADLAVKLHGPDLAVKISKVAARKKFIMPVEGYPIMAATPYDPQHIALVHALTRQESQFDPQAVSPSNAQGLMQLLPSTARYVAGKIGMDKDNLDIFDPATNVTLGSAYIGQMIDRFNGSLPLAVASYNAGPGRISRWIAAKGDPRQNFGADGAARMVDWVESIPFDETRNYVQRVMEALQVYRAKFAGGTAPLMIADDLTSFTPQVAAQE